MPAGRQRHWINRCICGRHLGECRCPGPKTVHTIEPCTHVGQPDMNRRRDEPKKLSHKA